MAKKLVRFDWAVKKLLRHKANYGILEGFLSELLKFDLKIESILESEGNKEDRYDKFNRVDMLVRTDKDELVLIELQNDPETDYFHRMIYGVSKLVTEYIKEGEPYGTIKKVFSVNIVYFSLGQGDDYVYQYKGEFIGMHDKSILTPSSSQKATYKVETIADIFPKYYILKVNNFDDNAKDSLDEWIYFLKNSEVKDSFKAKGLSEAKKKLIYEGLKPNEKKAYQRYQENVRIEKSVTATAEETGRKKGLEEGLQKGLKKVVKNAVAKGLDDAMIQSLTGLTLDELETIKKELSKGN